MSDSAATPHPPISEIVPQAGRAILLARVLEHGERHTLCEAGDAADYRTDDGELPSWVGLELMAQCMGAHGGLRARAGRERPRPGLILGSRRIDLHVPSFPRGQRLAVRAEHVWGERGLVSFACSIRDAETGSLLAEGVLNAVIPDDLDALLGAEQP